MKEEWLKRIHINPSYNRSENPWIINEQNGFFGLLDDGMEQEKLLEFLGITESQIGIFKDVVEVDGKLVFIPSFTDSDPFVRVRCQDKDKDIFLKKMNIRESVKNMSLFVCGFRFNQNVYIFGQSYPAIVKYNSTDDSVMYFNNWEEKIREFVKSDSNLGYFSNPQPQLYKDYLYIPISCASAYVKIDTVSDEEEVVFVAVKSGGFSCLSKIDENRILLAGAGENPNWLYVWNEEKREVEKTIRLQDAPNDLPVKYMLKSRDNMVYLFPWQNWTYQDMDIYMLNTKTWELENTHLIETYRDSSNREYLVGHEINYACWIDEDTFLYVTGKDLLWHEYNVATNEYREYEMLVNELDSKYESLMKDYAKALVKNKIPMNEKSTSIQELIELIQ